MILTNTYFYKNTFFQYGNLEHNCKVIFFPEELFKYNIKKEIFFFINFFIKNCVVLK